MLDANEQLSITGTRKIAEAVQTLIETSPGSHSYLAERKNLEGEVATWIVLATLGVQALPPVLDLIKSLLLANREPCQVKKIKVGDIEIECPSPEDIQRLYKIMDSRE